MHSDAAEVLLAVADVGNACPEDLLGRLKDCEQNRSYIEGISRGVNADERLSAVELLLDLASTVCDTSELVLARTDKGQPYFSGDAEILPHFSLSHTKDAVAVAVCKDMRVGVDIQTESGLDEDKMRRVAKRFFSEGELCRLDGSQNFTRDFLKIWTCKEAVSKLYGTGQPYLYDTEQKNVHYLSFSYGGGVLALGFEGLAYVRRDISPKDFWLIKR